MDYQEALKEVNNQKAPESGYLCIEISYRYSLLLPYKEGIKFLAVLENAEVYDRGYSSPPVIKEMNSNELKIHPVPRSEYQMAKVGQLLGITFDEVIKMKEEQANPTL